MKDKIKYGNSTIQYLIIKSKRRKTSQITVDESGVEVRTPLNKTKNDVKKIVKEKSQWIFKKQLEFEKRKKQKPVKTRTLSTKYLENKTLKLASKIGVEPSKVVIKNLKSRWGSSTKNGVINLNNALKKTPTTVADYIIIHELCHLIVKEHSRKYWSLVRKFMPNYRDKIVWLEANSKQILG